VIPEPPDDPEAWTDDQWLAWLEATDDAGTTAAGAGERPPPSWKQASTGTQLLASAMLGMAEAIYGPNSNEVELVAETPGEPLDDDPIEVHFDPSDPAAGRVILRPTPPPE
jgi:hypothetical protein